MVPHRQCGLLRRAHEGGGQGLRLHQTQLLRCGRVARAGMLSLVPQPAQEQAPRIRPSYAVFRPAGARLRALRGATHSIISEGSSLSPGKRLHHQRSSSSHDASPHPQGEPAPVAGRKFSDIGYVSSQFGISGRGGAERRHAQLPRLLLHPRHAADGQAAPAGV
jgi:hypothetical protein